MITRSITAVVTVSAPQRSSAAASLLDLEVATLLRELAHWDRQGISRLPPGVAEGRA